MFAPLRLGVQLTGEIKPLILSVPKDCASAAVLIAAQAASDNSDNSDKVCFSFM